MLRANEYTDEENVSTFQLQILFLIEGFLASEKLLKL